MVDVACEKVRKRVEGRWSVLRCWSDFVIERFVEVAIQGSGRFCRGKEERMMNFAGPNRHIQSTRQHKGRNRTTRTIAVGSDSSHSQGSDQASFRQLCTIKCRMNILASLPQCQGTCRLSRRSASAFHQD